LQTRWLATTVLLLLPAAAGAEQLDYGVRTQAGWTDNVYGTPEDSSVTSLGESIELEPVDDYSARISPWAQFSDGDGDFTGSIRYQPSYEYYVSETELNGFDHDASAFLAWRVGERTTLFLNDRFRQYRSILRFNENAGSLTEPAVLRGRRDEAMGNVTSFGVRRLLSPRDELTFSAGYTFREYEQAGSSDIDSWSVGSFYRHTLDPRTTIGLSGSWLRQTFSRQFGDDAITDYYNLSGSLEYMFSRTLRLELSAGPAMIDSNTEILSFARTFGVRSFAGFPVAIDADTCFALNQSQPVQPDPGLPGYNPRVARLGFQGCGVSSDRILTDEEVALVSGVTEFQPSELDATGSIVPLDTGDVGDPELTYFARMALVKEWEVWRAELSYERSADESGSFGGGSVRDALALGLRWQPAALWTFHLNTGVQLLEQAAEAAIPSLFIVQNQPVPAGVTSVPTIAVVQGVIVSVDDSALSYNYVYATLSASRKLTKRASAFASLNWYHQEQDLDPSGPVGKNTTKWNNVTLWVGVDWQFDTIKF
jgi:hypothetical protein